MNIIKRSGEETVFNPDKIYIAISKAEASVSTENISKAQIQAITDRVCKQAESLKRTPTVEEIQEMVIHEIMRAGFYDTAIHYIEYRYEHALRRKANTTDEKILTLLGGSNEDAKQENSNKNPAIVSVQRDYMAGEVSRDITRRFLLDEDISTAHDEGIIHFHDTDYFAQPIHNCCLINLNDMLQNGTVISGTLIEKPHSFSTACNVATQIIAQVASCQYGGQTITLSHLAPFVDISRKRIQEEVIAEFKTENLHVGNGSGSASVENAIASITEKRLLDEIRKGVQTLQYQIITLMTTNGQAPFVSINMYLNEVPEGRLRDDLAIVIEEVLRQRMEGVKNEKGVWITPAFPKLLYVLEENNVYPGSKYYPLTQLAAKCTAKRMVPDYISEKKMKEYKINAAGEGDCYPCMGCRSFLTPDKSGNSFGNAAKALDFDPNQPKYYGRFNQGVVTLNLVDVALSSSKDENEFWGILNERLELCHKALRKRHEHLLDTKSDVAPILWQNGALARLKKGETINSLLYNGYSTLSLGYAGVYEMTYYMTGHSHTDPEGAAFATKVMQHLNDACQQWKEAENIDYSVYGTPLESTTYKFAKCLQKRFGVIENVTDHSYITNSYHINVREPINAFDKLTKEAAFQKLSPGGAISYIEVPDMKDNIPAVLSVLIHIYETIMYAELNTKSDYCQRCGYDGEIQIVTDENGKLIWECPQCHNHDEDTMNVARRTCGYIGSQFWNQGRTAELKDRILHL